MKIKVTRAFWSNSKLHPVGAVLEVPDTQARELIALNKAEVVTAPEKKSDVK